MRKIQILGTGCVKCEQLAENAEFAAREMGIRFEIEKITDADRISEFGAVEPPALVIDGEIKIMGRASSPEEIKKLMGFKQTCSG